MATTSGVKMTYGSGGSKFSRTLSNMDNAAISDADDARIFANGYSQIVDGELSDIKFIVTTDVELSGE